MRIMTQVCKQTMKFLRAVSWLEMLHQRGLPVGWESEVLQCVCKTLLTRWVDVFVQKPPVLSWETFELQLF